MIPRPRLKEPDKSTEVPRQKMERHSDIGVYSGSRSPATLSPDGLSFLPGGGRHFCGRYSIRVFGRHRNDIQNFSLIVGSRFRRLARFPFLRSSRTGPCLGKCRAAAVAAPTKPLSYLHVYPHPFHSRVAPN